MTMSLTKTFKTLGLSGLLLQLALAPNSQAANYPPNNDYGQKGDFLVKRGVEKGRTAILATLGPLLINLPEGPGSSAVGLIPEGGDDVAWRQQNVTDTSWNLENLLDPQLITEINCDPNGENCGASMGLLAHGVYTRFVDGIGYLASGFRWQEGGIAYYDPTEPNLEDQIKRTTSISRPTDLNPEGFNKKMSIGLGYGAMTSPFSTQQYWDYGNAVLDDKYILTRYLDGLLPPQEDRDKVQRLKDQGFIGEDEIPDWRGEHVSDVWDHLTLTGVTGFPTFSGNLMIMASDQQNTGMAIYDISGLTKNTAPRLLSIFKPQLVEPNGNPIGLGGYWNEPYGANKMVFAARSTTTFNRDYPAFYVVDFTDPVNPFLSCEVYFDQDREDGLARVASDGDITTNPQYVNYQDQYAYVDHFQVDIEACEEAYLAAKAEDPDHMLTSAEILEFSYKFEDGSNYCDSSQYFRPLGQVGIFGGYNLGTKGFATFDRPLPESALNGVTAYMGNTNRDGGGAFVTHHGNNVYGIDKIIREGFEAGDVLTYGGEFYTVVSVDTSVSPNQNFQGMCFFVTSDTRDTKPPYVSGHRPLANQTNVPVDTFIHVHIPETLRSETVGNSVTVTRVDNGDELPIEIQLSHTGTLSIFPLEDLVLDVDYEVVITGIQDYMGNTMVPYSYRFTTGDDPVIVPPPPVDDDIAPTFSGTPYYANQSSQLSCSPESESNNLWAVNPDNHTVSIVNTEFDSDFILSAQVTQDISNQYRNPTSVTRVGDRYAVTYRESDVVVIYNQNGSEHRVIRTGYGTQPISSVADDNYLYVALYRKGVQANENNEGIVEDYGAILKIRISDFSLIASTNVGPKPKAMALRDNRLLVTRFISPRTHGEVYDLDTDDLSFTRTIKLNKVLVADDLDHGTGVPNFLNSISFSPDGTRAYVAAIKQNVENPDIDDDNAVRPMAAIIDLENNRDLNQEPINREGTLDYDNAADPQYFSYLANGHEVVVFQGNNQVKVINNDNNSRTTFVTGFGPQSSCSTLRTLYVKNFTDRSVSAIDVAEWMHDGELNPNIVDIALVDPADDVLDADELAGLKLFYHSEQDMFGLEGYISCASCHIGGEQDGQVWDMTRFGEGLRNTLSLDGQSGTRFGNLHWTSNFDELQDFIFQIINLNGGTADVEDFDASRDPLFVTTTGLSTKMDQLSAYIAGLGKDELRRSVVKSTAGDAAKRGEQLFYDRNCATCHAPPAFTDGLRHDVGTGLEVRTPRLNNLVDTAPYLHDGRAAQLSDVFTEGTTHANHSAALSAQEISDLITYLMSIDKNNFIDDSTFFTGLPSWVGQFGTLIDLPDLDDEWEYCAAEREVCTVPEGATIRYGANDVYHYVHNLSGEVNCTNAQFGDALPGTTKQCEYFVPDTTSLEEDEVCFPIKAKNEKVILICL